MPKALKRAKQEPKQPTPPTGVDKAKALLGEATAPPRKAPSFSHPIPPLLDTTVDQIRAELAEAETRYHAGLAGRRAKLPKKIKLAA